MNLPKKLRSILYSYSPIVAISDACNPLVYRVLDDHRRSVAYRPSPEQSTSGVSESSTANRYDLIRGAEDYYDEAIDISFVPTRYILISICLP